MNNCIEIPYDLIELGIKMDSRIIPILSFINSEVNRRGYSKFTLTEMIEYCNLKPKTGKGAMNEQFKNLLKEMIQCGFIIDIEDKIDNIKPSEVIKMKFNSSVGSKFLKLEIDKVDSIMNIENVDNSLLLKIYFYIEINKNISITKIKIANDCNFSEGTIDKYYTLLKGMHMVKEIMFKESMPYVYIHINKLNQEVLYVGKGRKDRYKDLESRSDKYVDFIKSIGADNIECTILEYFKDDRAAFINEYDVATKYRSIGQAKYCIDLGNRYILDGQ